MADERVLFRLAPFWTQGFKSFSSMFRKSFWKIQYPLKNNFCWFVSFLEGPIWNAEQHSNPAVIVYLPNFQWNTRVGGRTWNPPLLYSRWYPPNKSMKNQVKICIYIYMHMVAPSKKMEVRKIQSQSSHKLYIYTHIFLNAFASDSTHGH